MELHEQSVPSFRRATNRDCPDCGSTLYYYFDGSYDPRLVCEQDNCDFWGLT